MAEKVSFKANGHKNITAKHKTTFEFTKDSYVSETGDCIIGVNSDFSIPPDFISENREIIIEMKAEGISERVCATINPDFSDAHEIVVRKSDFNSDRTIAVRADKACADLSPEFRNKLKDPQSTIRVTISRKG